MEKFTNAVESNKKDISFYDLFGSKLLPILKQAYEFDSEQFKIEVKNENFLSQIFQSHRFSERDLDIPTMEFLLDKGYEPFVFKTTTTHSDKIGKCDFSIYQYMPEDTLIYLTHLFIKHGGQLQDIIDTGAFLLHKAVSLQKMKWAEILLSYGLNPKDSDQFGREVGHYAESKPEILSTYNALIEKYCFLNEDDKAIQYKKTLSALIQSAKKIDKNNIKYDTNHTAFLSLLESELPKYDRAKQEEMIATTLYSSYYPLLGKSLKLIGESPKTYQPKYYPLWKNLGEAQHQHFLYYFFETNPITLDSISPQYNKDKFFYDKDNENESFLGQLAYYCNKNNIKTYHKTGYGSSYRGSSEQRDKKIHEYINKNLTVDFLLSENILDNKNNWFTTLCQSQKLSSLFYPFFRYISEQSSSQLKEDLGYESYVQELLSQTWFAKNEQGICNLDSLLEQRSYLMSQNTPTLFDNKYIEQDNQYNLFTPAQKIKLFYITLNDLCSWNGTDSKNRMEALLNNLSQDPAFSWELIKIEDKQLKDLEKYSPSIYSQINTVILHNKLNHTTEEKSSNVVRNKI